MSSHRTENQIEIRAIQVSRNLYFAYNVNAKRESKFTRLRAAIKFAPRLVAWPLWSNFKQNTQKMASTHLTAVSQSVNKWMTIRGLSE